MSTKANIISHEFLLSEHYGDVSPRGAPQLLSTATETIRSKCAFNAGPAARPDISWRETRV
ncbi:hypothetical protein N7519_009424 [Penicillium mononematosum]|uniref:uncharacterized protein n=1 Tax=Penicillium mononematosum TaxID=268346 RepID=UPI0025483AD6|nr:uncharacterized protein N7519_009424 [Penicillium mononematosum]KAJ6178963.1 hypothetical protein N7519_009424 [Penicillium mononematosum]